MSMTNPYPKGSRLYKIKSNKSTMAAINRQNSQISADYSNSSSAFLSIESAESSVANDSFEADPDGKLQSLHDAARNIRIAMPNMRKQSRSNAVTYQRLKSRNRDLDGQNAALGAEIASTPSATTTANMVSSMKSANSKAADENWKRIRRHNYGI